MNKQKILIIGQSGLLSLSLQKYFYQKNIPYVTTSRSHLVDSTPHSCISFDLEKKISDQLKNINLTNFSHAIICAGMTKLDYCYRYPEKSQLINQTHTIALCDYLLAHHIIPIYCSSDLVFDGTQGNYQEEDPCHPLNEYGLQKRNVETFLINYFDKMLILRFSKLYSISEIDTSPVREIFSKLSKNIPLNCAVNLTISPTNVDEICHAIFLLIESKSTGIYHLSPGLSGKYSRYDFAIKFASRLKKTDLIHSCLLSELQLPFVLGHDNSLNSDKFFHHFGFRFTTLDENLNKIWQFYMS